MNIKSILIEKANAAMQAAGIPEGTNPAVTQSTRPQFGDYQIMVYPIKGFAEVYCTHQYSNWKIIVLVLQDVIDQFHHVVRD